MLHYKPICKEGNWSVRIYLVLCNQRGTSKSQVGDSCSKSADNLASKPKLTNNKTRKYKTMKLNTVMHSTNYKYQWGRGDHCSLRKASWKLQMLTAALMANNNKEDTSGMARPYAVRTLGHMMQWTEVEVRGSLLNMQLKLKDCRVATGCSAGHWQPREGLRMLIIHALERFT